MTELALSNRDPLLAVEDLVVEYPTDAGPLRAVNGVSLSVAPGEVVAVVGESGAGKSATALAVMGLHERGVTVDGSIRLGGRELVGLDEPEYRKVRGADVAVVFQDATAALNPSMRVGAQVAEAFRVHGSEPSRKAARARAVERLEELGLPAPRAAAHAYPHQLSGGMRQRAMLAMALANRPRLLVADEPTTALDSTTQAHVLDALERVRAATGLAVLLVTHDLGIVAGFADRIVVLYAGRVVEDGPTREVLQAPRHPYTIGLLESVPRVASAKRRLPVIPGTAPDLRALPMGCVFHPRCAFANDQCMFHRPQLRALGRGHSSACLRVEHLPLPVRWRG